MSKAIYLDYNSTTPVDPRVLDSMLPYFIEKFGNAASNSHPFGWEADEAVHMSREQVAGLIGAKPKEITFTSGATEAINLAIKGLDQTGHILTCSTEHKAVLDVMESMKKTGNEVTYLPARSDGLIDLESLEKSIQEDTFLICIMHANNETGIIQSMKKIGAMAKERGILFMSDATQSVGKIPVNVNELGVDLMTFSSHKMYGPKGMGALYVRSKNPKVEIHAQIEGGGHERGMRSGTLNIPGIVGFGKACEICGEQQTEDSAKLRRLRDKLESELIQIEGTTINGSRDSRLPHVSSISFSGVNGEKLLLSLKDISVSNGSACTSAITKPSHVLISMGISEALTYSSIRFSLGRFTTEEEIDFAIKKVKEVVTRLRK
ncbi:MAG: aminotransferase class V-fold PLP-dependent enzyme [Bacteroidota bacterium]